MVGNDRVNIPSKEISKGTVTVHRVGIDLQVTRFQLPDDSRPQTEIQGMVRLKPQIPGGLAGTQELILVQKTARRLRRQGLDPQQGLGMEAGENHPVLQAKAANLVPHFFLHSLVIKKPRLQLDIGLHSSGCNQLQILFQRGNSLRCSPPAVCRVQAA